MMEHRMRRFKQQLPDGEARDILLGGRECVLAVVGDDGYPYAVPVNYVYDGECIYLHSAGQGHKIDALRRNDKVSLCVVEQGNIVPEEFTTYFRSVIVFGRARIVEGEQEKVEALLKLCRKYCGDLDATAEIARFINPVAIIEISIDRITGKESIELARQRQIN